MSTLPPLSVVIASHNRRDVLLGTLDRLRDGRLGVPGCEIIVVDNASTDGTVRALAARSDVHVIALDRNLGACAKGIGVADARAPLLLFLDDDSYPRAGCVPRMIERFACDPRLAAAGFTVHLSDGSQECSAMPHVHVGCGVGLRKSAVQESGGVDLSFFMAAEEYDLTFRLLRAGWRAEIFADLQVEHLKSPVGRRSERITFYDIRNNLRVLARYVPDGPAGIYAADWIERYRWMAEVAGHRDAFEQGLIVGQRLAASERERFWRLRFDERQFEAVFRWGEIERRSWAVAQGGARRVVLADLSKNVHAFVRGALRAGLEILAIADDALSGGGRAGDGLRGDVRRYRGIPVLKCADALALAPDVVVVSNTSYVHAQRRSQWLRGVTKRPVLNWFAPPSLQTTDALGAPQCGVAVPAA
ncbi:MAG: glycosyltransferase family 2 protein [Phycisphaerae bacterium]|jgi:GT2 family glycosyltransferase